MSKVFVSVGMSTDGFIAGPNRGPQNPLGDGGTAIHQWMYGQQAFLEHFGVTGGKANNRDNDMIAETFRRAGSHIMGKRMFEEGEANWPEEAPFRAPVFVLTHEKREPWPRKGGTTFYFVNDGIESAIRQAKQAAGERDIRIAGGADIIQQYLNARFIDEMTLHIAPVLLTDGVRLFDSLEKDQFRFEISDVVNSPDVTHVIYRVVRQ